MKIITKQQKPLFYFTIFMFFLSSIVSLASAYFLYLMLNNVMIDSDLAAINLNQTYLYLGLILFLDILNFLVDLFASLLIIKVKRMTHVHIKSVITSKINSLSASEYEELKKGDLLSWYNSDAPKLCTTLLESLIYAISNFLLFVSSLVMVFVILGWILGLVTIAVSFLLIIFSQLITPIVQKGVKELSKENEHFSETTENLLNGYNEFRYRNQKHTFNKILLASSQKVEDRKVYVSKFQTLAFWLYSVLGVFFQLGVQSVAIILFLFGKVEVAAIFTILQLSGYFMEGFQNFIEYFFTMKSGKPIMQKFLPIKPYQQAQHQSLEFKHLAIKDLDFAIGDKQIFNKFNLEIHPQKKYLIVGESGRGKSTLIKIIYGILEPDAGELVLNHHLNYQQLNKETLWNMGSYLAQENVVFDDTIRNNLTLWNSNVNDEQIMSVLKQVNLEKLLDGDGLNKVINPENKNLSGGEIQRIAIARNLLQDKPILIFDEATSALDKENRDLIEKIIDGLDKTVLFVSHTTNIQNNVFDEVIRL